MLPLQLNFCAISQLDVQAVGKYNFQVVPFLTQSGDEPKAPLLFCFQVKQTLFSSHTRKTKKIRP